MALPPPMIFNPDPKYNPYPQDDRIKPGVPINPGAQLPPIYETNPFEPEPIGDSEPIGDPWFSRFGNVGPAARLAQGRLNRQRMLGGENIFRDQFGNPYDPSRKVYGPRQVQTQEQPQPQPQSQPNDYTARRFIAPKFGQPGQPITLPDGRQIIIPEEGLTQAEYDALSGLRQGLPVGGPNAQNILMSLVERGVITGTPGEGSTPRVIIPNEPKIPGTGGIRNIIPNEPRVPGNIRNIIPNEPRVPGTGISIPNYTFRHLSNYDRRQLLRSLWGV